MNDPNPRKRQQNTILFIIYFFLHQVRDYLYIKVNKMFKLRDVYRHTISTTELVLHEG